MHQLLTGSPVVNWVSVCLLLAVAKIHGLPSKSIDFVLAFRQADLEVPFLHGGTAQFEGTFEWESKAIRSLIEQEFIWS